MNPSLRKAFKIAHSLAACGMIGGLGAYALLLVLAPQETLGAYADLRRSIEVIAHYLVIPSLALAAFTGVCAMIVHKPFLDQRWVWLKAIMGLAMFEGTLLIVGGRTKEAAQAARRIADGEAGVPLDALISREWVGLAAIAALSIANVIVGVWRPRLRR